MREQFAEGIAWGEAKKQLFELVNTQLADARARYEVLMQDPAKIEKILRQGAEKARGESQMLIAKVRHAVGIRPLV